MSLGMVKRDSCSGKRALLDVIARRVPSKGHILLEGVPLEEDQFNNTCALVRHSTKLLPGLTVQQTLALSLTKISGYLKSSKVKQVMADLALSQVGGVKTLPEIKCILKYLPH
ncbi:hypothetical protein evm_000167 [Chilo suppressalis]|nr:hypothetical protein evm_000167 [Chilo suppressalis]